VNLNIEYPTQLLKEKRRTISSCIYGSIHKTVELHDKPVQTLCINTRNVHAKHSYTHHGQNTSQLLCLAFFMLVHAAVLFLA